MSPSGITERLYYADAYLSAFSSTIAAVEGARVYLATTAFYPTSGGQPHDTGTLGVTPVVDVVDEGERIAHVLATPLELAVGADIAGRVDWPRRFDFMQQHTGQHLLSAVFDDLFGAKTVSVHFGDTTATLDIDLDALDPVRVRQAAHRANEIVLENRTVRVTFEDALSAAGLRKPTGRTGDIRVVEIDGIDRSACGGTHVRTTGEIGPLMIRRVEKIRKHSRVEFLCGWRALAGARRDFEVITNTASSLSCGIDDLAGNVQAQAERLRTAESEQRRLLEQLAESRAAALHARVVPDASGLRRLEETASSIEELRFLAQAFSRLPGVVFVGRLGNPPTVVFATSDDSGINAGAQLKALLAIHGGRGGGAPRVAQGTLSEPGAMEALVRDLLSTSS